MSSSTISPGPRSHGRRAGASLLLWASAIAGMGARASGAAPPPNPPPPVVPPAARSTDVVESRREDLAFLIRELPAKHANAFAVRSKEAFTADAEALRSRLESLDDAEFMIEMSRLVASLGDGHTSLGKTLGRYPMQVGFFSDGPRVIVLPKAHGELLGAKLVGVGGQPIDEVLRRIETIDFCETETALRAKARTYVIAPEVLHGLGLAAPRSATFALERPDGTRVGLALDALSNESKPEWATLPPGGALVRMRDSRRGAILVPLDDRKAVYLGYRACSVDPQAPIDTLMQSLFERIDRDAPRRVVIDLRGNGGGNSALLSKHLPELARRAKEHERGWLAVLIDRHTYSSAMMNAWQLRRECGAVLYGEPTGGAKNHFGEIRTFTLPKSGLTVYYSTKYFKLDDEGAVPVRPDVVVAESFADYQAGRDAPLEAALE